MIEQAVEWLNESDDWLSPPDNIIHYLLNEVRVLTRYAGLMDRHADLGGAPLQLTRKIGEARKELSPETIIRMSAIQL